MPLLNKHIIKLIAVWNQPAVSNNAEDVVVASSNAIPGNILFISPELLAQAKKSVAILIPCTYSCCLAGNFNQTALSLGQ